jgi:hypothetical protein
VYLKLLYLGYSAINSVEMLTVSFYSLKILIQNVYLVIYSKPALLSFSGLQLIVAAVLLELGSIVIDIREGNYGIDLMVKAEVFPAGVKFEIPANDPT